MTDYKKMYEERLERASVAYKDEDKHLKATLERIFPELKKSEDEEIKRELIDFIVDQCNKNLTLVPRVGEKWVAWLEKQGEQKPIKDHDVCDFCEDRYGCVSPCPMKLMEEEKPTDKVEPKFKIGDRIKKIGIGYASWDITGIDEMRNVYEGRYKEGYPTSLSFFEQDDFEIVEQKPAWSEEDKRIWNIVWDMIDGKFAVSDLAEKEAKDWFISLRDRFVPQPKQEWSKEDRRHIEKLILNVNAKEFPDEVDWLISLHDKIAPPYWDKEDEEMLNQAIHEVEYALNDKNIAFSGREPVLLWLKHLRPQNRWKPSDEQMQALLKLEEMHVLEHERNQENAHLYMVVKSIREQLLKLKEE